MSTSLTSATLPIARSSSVSDIPPDIAKMTFPLLFGPLVNWTLYGVLCVQIYVYSYNFPDDRPAVKTVAYFVFVLETVQTALTGADVWFWFVDGFGNVERLQDSHFAPIDIPIIHSIISFVVQGCLCYRIWTLNKRSSKFCLVIGVFTILQSIGSMWGGIESIAAGGKYAVSKTALYLWSIPSAIADILIAVAMILLYSRTRSNGGRFSNFVMTRLVRLTIETNALTASVAVSSFILFVVFPKEIYYVFLVEFITKLYSNTLMVSLNNRIYFREYADRPSGINTDSSHSDRTHRSAFASIRLNQVGSPTNTATAGNTFKLNTISHVVGQEKSKGDAIGMASDDSC